MKKIFITIIVCFIIVLLRENICFMIGNIFNIFKKENNYYEGIIILKDEKIKYLEEEIKNSKAFLKDISKINYDYKISKIIYKESYNAEKYIIEYGKSNNIKEGNAVINEIGLIGKITKVDKNTSELTILKGIEDLSVKINETYGKLNYNYETNEFIITDISNYDKVHINDEVYTSGYGSIKEKIYIGKIYKIKEETLSKKLYIKVDTDFNNLNYVLIVGDY